MKKLFVGFLLMLNVSVAHAEETSLNSIEVPINTKASETAGWMQGIMSSAVSNCDGIFQAFGSRLYLSQWKIDLPKAFNQGHELGINDAKQILSIQDALDSRSQGCKQIVQLFGPAGTLAPGHLVTSIDISMDRQ